jgi:hypothetical protein
MPCYKIALTEDNALFIEYSSDDGFRRYIYSSETGAPVTTGLQPGDCDIVITINHYQLIAALKAMARDAPGDYSGG